MTQGKINIKIDKRISERKMLELIFNYSYQIDSGAGFLLFFIYALETRMDIQDFEYYLKEIEGGKKWKIKK